METKDIAVVGVHEGAVSHWIKRRRERGLEVLNAHSSRDRAAPRSKLEYVTELGQVHLLATAANSPLGTTNHFTKRLAFGKVRINSANNR